MMISLFDWIWIEIIAVTSTGAVAYCLVMGRKAAQDEMETLRDELEHQRSRKKFWKARAKGQQPMKAEAAGTAPISLANRRVSLGASGTSH